MRVITSSIPKRITTAVGALVISAASCVWAGDDSAASQFKGVWQTTVVANGQTIVCRSSNTGDHYDNSMLGPGGWVSVASGNFSVGPNDTFNCQGLIGPSDHGIYHFNGTDKMITRGQSGLDVVWTRVPANAPTTNPAVAMLPADADVRALAPLLVAQLAKTSARAWFADAVLVSVLVDRPSQNGTIDLTAGGSVRCAFYSPEKKAGVIAMALPNGVIITLPIGFPPGPNLSAIPEQAIDLPKTIASARAHGLNVNFTGAELNVWDLKKQKPTQVIWSMKTLDDTGNTSCLVSATTGKLVPPIDVTDDAIKDYNELADKTQQAITAAVQRVIEANRPAPEPDAAPTVQSSGYDNPIEHILAQQRAAEQAAMARARGDGAEAARQEYNAHH